jgi:hypothetical protein
MSNLSLKFDILEAPDARSFVFYDRTGNHNLNNPGGWGAPNAANTSVTSATLTAKNVKSPLDVKTFTLPTDSATWSGVGVENFHPSGIFDDGVYLFELSVTAGGITYTATAHFGFAALIKAETMQQCLAYTPRIERKLKEFIEEKMRLLNNLYYAAQTGQIDHFQDNLVSLQKLK